MPEEVKLRPISGSSVKGTLHGATLGTPQYMSPEQALGQLDRVSRASDVYGLGATLYCILTGSPPLAQISDVGAVLSRVALGDIPPPRSLKPDVPATLEAICKKAMAVRPEDRYASVRGLAADIESWLADEPVQGVAEPVASRLAAWERKHRTFFRVSALALLVVALVAVVAALFVNAARERAEARRREAIELSRIADARKQEADRQRDALRHLTTRLTLDRGLSLLASGSRRAGVLWLARSLENASGQHDPARARHSSQSGAWFPLIHRLRDCLEHDAPVRTVAFEPDWPGDCHGQRRRRRLALGLDRPLHQFVEQGPETSRRGACPGVLARWQDAGDRLRRPDRVAVEHGLGPAAGRAHAPPRAGGLARVQPG